MSMKRSSRGVRQHHALHDADEGFAQSEVGRQRDESIGAKGCHGISRIRTLRDHVANAPKLSITRAPPPPRCCCLCACFVPERHRGTHLSDRVDAPVRHRLRHLRTRGGDRARGLHGRPGTRRIARRAIPAARDAPGAHLRAARARHRARARCSPCPLLLSLADFGLAALFGGQAAPPDSDHAGTTLFYLVERIRGAGAAHHAHGRDAADAGALRGRARKRRSAGASALLYAMNTAGAVVGALLTAFVLLPEFGLTHTIWFAAALNGLVFLLAAALAQRVSRAAARPRATRWMPTGRRRHRASAHAAPSTASRDRAGCCR